MAKTLLCKLLQRKTYDALSKKHTLLFLFTGTIILFVATLHFGETLIDWSKEKYAVVFSPYSDNILGKSYRNMLCQYVPIDVVYTWVNGSDPKFLKELYHAKEDYGFFGSNVNCSFSNCVKSNMVLVRPELPTSITLSDLEEIDSAFQHILKTFVISTQSKNNENITVLVFSDIYIADKVISMSVLQMDGQNYSLNVGYITNNWASQHTVLLDNAFVITQIPSGYSEQDISEKLPDYVRPYASKVFLYEEKSMAILYLSKSGFVNSALNFNITFESKVSAISSAYLVVQLPSDHEDISASRFTDNEELRYSLRSLEKHAPWIRHVYIITNGQIPSWLNLDYSRVSIVTHEEIFPNKSHLPTFSSPAIECHLHRIPNLSDKFLYLNDDVMFGKDVWPEDFYTHTKGQKVYLSWPVPNCAEGCPSSWIRDGYCDKPCNNSQCQWDGGDCTADNPMLSFQNLHHDVTSFFHLRTTNKAYCNSECADTWLADRYCDKACNVRACGFDAGDCGLENFDKLPQLTLSSEESQYYLPDGECVGYFNLTNFFESNYTLSEGFYEENPIVRSLAISLKYSIIGIVLYPNHNATNLNITLKGEFSMKPFEKIIHLHVHTNEIKTSTSELKSYSSTYQTEEPFTFQDFSNSLKYPKIHGTKVKVPFSEFANVNVSASNLPGNITKSVQKLKELLDKGLITVEGFKRKKTELLANYVHNYNFTYQKMPNLVTETYKNISMMMPLDKLSSEHIVNSSKINLDSHANLSSIVKKDFFYSKNSSMATNNTKMNRLELETKLIFPRMLKNVPVSAPSLIDYFKGLSNFTTKKAALENGRHSLINPTQRHLLDTFGDSLRHVNKLYNEAFGYEARKVPSHIAHFVDKSVMSRLTEKFDSYFDITSSHKIRSSNDMQFAFSYYYYLMSEMEVVEVKEIFDSFDVDKSGTWSDREIRTVLTRLYDLPLDFSSVAGFEQIIINCSRHSSQQFDEEIVTHRENYYDSNLPLVTQSLILSCPAVSNLLLQHFGSRKKNSFEVVGEEEVAFKMIHNNLSQVLGQIDDLRKHPKKFVCLNDNMNHGTREAEVIRAVIQDFYESLFPTRSQFELPPEYRNRFLYVNELIEWRKTRDIIRVVTYTSLGLLILFSIISFWRSEMRIGNHLPRRRNLQNMYRNPQPV